MSSEEFKTIMRHWPTGVAVVTTKYNNQLFGLTVNSFTSVSLSPPLVSFCINKNSGSFLGFTHNSEFTINILAEDQQEIAINFATKKIDKFAHMQYKIGKLDSSILIDNAVCFLECEKLYEYDGGDHVILVAKVQYCTQNNNNKPLLYFAKEYRHIK